MLPVQQNMLCMSMEFIHNFTVINKLPIFLSLKHNLSINGLVIDIHSYLNMHYYLQ